jgi:hypothetical protein
MGDVPHELLRISPAGLSSPEACLERARELRVAYRRLDRGQVDAARILEIKFAHLYWRHRLLTTMLEAPSFQTDGDDNTLTGIVDALGSRLPDALMSRLARQLGPDASDYLLARQGTPPRHSERYRSLAGPGVTLDIRANRSSVWPFARWKRRFEFSTYEFEGDGVNFRGLHLRPGDILLANVNIDGNGVYTTLSDPTRFSSHAAVFAILEDGGKHYPAVIETYEKGVRAVPLNVFLGPRFCAYVEIYRHNDLGESHAAAVNRSALDLIRRARGYNFDSTADDRDYVSCCAVGRLLHIDAGLEPASCKSRIAHPRIQENLEKLGYTWFDFFAPVDYLLDPGFHCVGWVDNHQFHDLLARELVESQFRELFMTRRLNPDRFPFMSRINHWGIRHIRRQSPLGKAIGLVEGFDHRSLPKGPDPLMAVITLAENQLGRVIRRMKEWLQAKDHEPEYFSLAGFSRQPEVKAWLEANVQLPWLEQ